MTCKNCVHYGICLWTRVDAKHKKVCKEFKNKADFAEVKRGKWIVPSGKIKRFEGRYVICSECNVMIPVIMELDRYWFCPNCGAKMDEERK